MNIKQASTACGLSVDTIRFYERRGIVPPPGRAANGYRDYTERHVETLRFAKGLRDLGVALPEIAAMVRLAHDGTCRDLREAMLLLIDETQRQLNARLRALQATKRELGVLRTGIARVSAGRANIPGITPCRCVESVAQRGTAAKSLRTLARDET